MFGLPADTEEEKAGQQGMDQDSQDQGLALARLLPPFEGHVRVGVHSGTHLRTVSRPTRFTFCCLIWSSTSSTAS